MYHKRKDKGCESRILGVYRDRVLIEARWPIGAKQPSRNIVEVSRKYFVERYGESPLNEK